MRFRPTNLREDLKAVTQMNGRHCLSIKICDSFCLSNRVWAAADPCIIAHGLSILQPERYFASRADRSTRGGTLFEVDFRRSLQWQDW